MQLLKPLKFSPSKFYPLHFPFTHLIKSRLYSNSSDISSSSQENSIPRGRWVTLPPYSPSMNLAKNQILGDSELVSTTALKWVRFCCPNLPVNLVQKLFRLRQVRREVDSNSSLACTEQEASRRSLKRISGKEILNVGDLIHLPITVEENPQQEKDASFTQEEVDYVRNLELYKDKSIIAVNKPHGLPVQGGVGIKMSMDVLAEACLKYDYNEPPCLVHRLDRECSGVLVLGRNRISASILHSIFREKTLEATDERESDLKNFRKKYWALVFGRPRNSKGLINAPLRKVSVDNYEKIAPVAHDGQDAVTEYEVVETSNGFSWLALFPLTGRKHQLRVHCAEVLGTPIVGDLKYGWSKHKKWQPWCRPSTWGTDDDYKHLKDGNGITLAGMNLEGNSILEKRPSLHLHCRQMVIPDISLALRNDLVTPSSKVKVVDLIAPLPPHMQRSWDALAFST